MIYIIPTDTCFGIACKFSDKKNYHKIYKIKKRDTKKPLAILVQDIKWLEEYSELNPEQIDFLRNYNRPFTVLTQCPHIQVYLGFEDEEGMYENNEIYKQIGFRVAHNDIQDDLVRSNGPLWLTSANLSGKPELYNNDHIQEQFQYYIDNNIIEVLWHEELDSDIQPSDVFGFEWETTKQIFVRQN